ncbi:MAG: hypothetical protein NTW78_04015 [Campylobacterales bacterium]|nr:hypothetical protein [Campylobacterales bacterium]
MWKLKLHKHGMVFNHNSNDLELLKEYLTFKRKDGYDGIIFYDK